MTLRSHPSPCRESSAGRLSADQNLDSFPCSMLNLEVYEHFTNSQYQTWDGDSRKWKISKENT